jgi:hypothetical protein
MPSASKLNVAPIEGIQGVERVELPEKPAPLTKAATAKVAQELNKASILAPSPLMAKDRMPVSNGMIISNIKNIILIYKPQNF